MKTLLRADQVAALLQVSRWRVYDLARQGVLPSVRIGRAVRFDPDALAVFISRGGAEVPDAPRDSE